MAETKTATKEKNMMEMMTVKIPKQRGESDTVVISCNDKIYTVKRGEKVELPRCIVEVWQNREAAQDELDRRLEQLTSSVK